MAKPTGGMTMLMRMQVAAQGFPVSDVVKTRLVLESEVIQSLASRTPTPDLSTAVELLDSMDDVNLSAEEFLLLDAQFHVALADAAGNQVIILPGSRSSACSRRPAPSIVRPRATRLPRTSSGWPTGQ